MSSKTSNFEKLLGMRYRLQPKTWWSQTGSNRRSPECKSGALPAELWPLRTLNKSRASLNESESAPRSDSCASTRAGLRTLVGLGGFEPPTSPLSGVRSNQLSYRPGHLWRTRILAPDRADCSVRGSRQWLFVALSDSGSVQPQPRFTCTRYPIKQFE